MEAEELTPRTLGDGGGGLIHDGRDVVVRDCGQHLPRRRGGVVERRIVGVRGGDQVVHTQLPLPVSDLVVVRDQLDGLVRVPVLCARPSRRSNRANGSL
jgi:hypothetical protein